VSGVIDAREKVCTEGIVLFDSLPPLTVTATRNPSENRPQFPNMLTLVFYIFIQSQLLLNMFYLMMPLNPHFISCPPFSVCPSIQPHRPLQAGSAPAGPARARERPVGHRRPG